MTILGDLEHPVPEGSPAAVTTGMTQCVASRPHPQAQVNGEPAVAVVLGVTVPGVVVT